MKKQICLSLTLVMSLVLGMYAVSLAMNGVPCTDTTNYCQKKVAQVPIPWQFWGIVTDPTTGATTVIDRIRISPTWLNPPPGQPPGTAPIFVRRHVAVAPNPVPLEGLLWDFENDAPPTIQNVRWQMVDQLPVEVVQGEDLELEIAVAENDMAVLVAYEVFMDTVGLSVPVGHFINEAVLGLNSAQTILEVRINFDVHNNIGIDVTNFELDFWGLDFGCDNVRGALGFIAAQGLPPVPVVPEAWGANEDNPLVVRPIPGGTEVKWVQPDRPLKTCEWLHVGLVFDCTNFDCFNNPDDPTLRATVQGYWTILEPKVCDPRTQGFWKRICDGATEKKRLHPETPDGFNPDLWCGALQVKGEKRSDPCLRAKAQIAALLYNIEYGYLSDCCEVVDAAGDQITVGQALMRIQELLESGLCKEAADLAEAINSGYALMNDP